MSDLVRKTKVVPFINTGTGDAPVWTQIKKSTAFTLSLNPQTKTFDFISSDVAQTEVDSYQPSLDQSLTMFKGEDDYELFFDLLFNLPTGSDAHRDVLVAFYQESGTDSSGADVYKAWLVDAVVQVNQMDTVNETIDISLSLNSPTVGAVSLSGGSPAFSAGTWSGSSFVAAS